MDFISYFLTSLVAFAESIAVYIWGYLVPHPAAIILWVQNHIGWFLSEVQNFTGFPIGEWAGQASVLLHAVGILAAMYISLIIKMEYFTDMLAAGIYFGCLAVMIRVVVMIKNHVWSAGA